MACTATFCSRTDRISYGGVDFARAQRDALEQLLAPVHRAARNEFIGYTLEHAESPVTAVAILRVDAHEGTAARALAMRRLRSVRDALNFFLPFTAPRNIRSRIWLAEDGRAHDEHTLTYVEGDQALDGDGFKATTHGRRDGYRPHARLPSDDDPIVPWHTRVGRMLAGPRTDFEEHVLDALLWSGRAALETDRGRAFLLNAIALESLLFTKPGGELAYRIGVRAAHLLGGDTEDRKRLKKLVCDLYDLRSKLVHSGRDRVTERDVDVMLDIVGYSILELLHAKGRFAQMTTRKELEEWFEDRVLEAVDPADRS